MATADTAAANRERIGQRRRRDVGVHVRVARGVRVRCVGDVRIDPRGLTRDDWLDLLMTHRLQPSFPADRILHLEDGRLELAVGGRRVPAVRHPLADIAAHVIQTKRVGIEAAHRRSGRSVCDSDFCSTHGFQYDHRHRDRRRH